MKNMKKHNKWIATIISVAVVITVLLAAPVIAYLSIYNTLGLTLYYDDEIVELYAGTGDTVYLVDADDNLYMVGNYYRYRDVSDRKYSCVAPKWNEKLHMPPPVRVYSGGVQAVFPEDDLFISKSGELFFVNAHDDIQRIADSAIFACGDKNGGNYVVDTANALWHYTEEAPVRVAEGVRSVSVHKERLFLLYENGELCELLASGEKNVLLSNVKKFSLDDSSYFYDSATESIQYGGGESENEQPTFFALTEDGQLLAQGILVEHAKRNAETKTTYYSEWEVLLSNVKQYDSNYSGVLAITHDGKCVYEGYAPNENGEEIYCETVLPVENPLYVQNNLWAIYVGTTDRKIFAWCERYSYCILHHEHDCSILTGDPIVVQTFGDD